MASSPIPSHVHVDETTIDRTGWSRQWVRLVAYVQLLLLDSASILAAFTAAAQLRGHTWLSPEGYEIGLLVLPLYVMLAFNRDAYSIEVLKSASESMRRCLSALFVTMMIVLMVGFFVQAGSMVSRVAFAGAIASSGLLMVMGRLLLRHFLVRRYDGILTDELLVLDGVEVPHANFLNVVNVEAMGLAMDLQNPKMMSRLADLVSGHDRVVVACRAERQQAWSLFLKGTDVIGELLMLRENKVGAVGLNRLGDRDTLVVCRGPLSFANRVKKRGFDLFFTVPAIIFLAPLFVAVAIAIRLESSGPVFFRQPRVGQGNRMFDILKFRSMRTESCDSNGHQSTRRDDDRITRVGAFIRKTSIDELPQLINVLRGDMSLVGPRPHALGSLAGDKLFWEVNEQYWMRHALKPGITGLAQIRGFRGATHHQQDLEDRLQSDLEYLNGWRLWRDITILFGTFKVLVHHNAY